MSAPSSLCDGCSTSLVWTGTEWLHAAPTRCNHFDFDPVIAWLATHCPVLSPSGLPCIYRADHPHRHSWEPSPSATTDEQPEPSLPQSKGQEPT